MLSAATWLARTLGRSQKVRRLEDEKLLSF
jgi:hypothetical protein